MLPFLVFCVPMRIAASSCRTTHAVRSLASRESRRHSTCEHEMTWQEHGSDESKEKRSLRTEESERKHDAHYAGRIRQVFGVLTTRHQHSYGQEYRGVRDIHDFTNDF